MFWYWGKAPEPSRPDVEPCYVLVMSLCYVLLAFYLAKFSTNCFAADPDFSHRIEQS